jgi:SAM-dependent methyltransferase
MNKTPEYNFWNNQKIVKQFSDAKFSKYWKDFLNKFKKTSYYRVLDLGCGGGRNTELLIKMGFNTYACDLYDSMVKATKKKVSGLLDKRNIEKRIVKVSMLKLPFKKESFDIVIANGVYHNTNSPSQFINAIRETNRITKKNGFLCLNVFYKGIVAPELCTTKLDNLFITKEGLHLILLSKRKILLLLKNLNLLPFGEIVTYNRKVNTGLRSVLRGVFKKLK